MSLVHSGATVKRGLKKLEVHVKVSTEIKNKVVGNFLQYAIPQLNIQVQVHLFTLIQLQYNNKEKKKEEVKNRANYTLN